MRKIISFFGSGSGSYGQPTKLAEGAAETVSSNKDNQIRTIKEQPHRKRSAQPRFAPELDGVHCFETILPS